MPPAALPPPKLGSKRATGAPQGVPLLDGTWAQTLLFSPSWLWALDQAWWDRITHSIKPWLRLHYRAPTLWTPVVTVTNCSWCRQVLAPLGVVSSFVRWIKAKWSLPVIILYDQLTCKNSGLDSIATLSPQRIKIPFLPTPRVLKLNTGVLQGEEEIFCLLFRYIYSSVLLKHTYLLTLSCVLINATPINSNK